MTAVTNPFGLFSDNQSRLLDNGYVYIGLPEQDPEANPAPVFWDEELTIPAAQPIRTIGGMTVNETTSSPGIPYVDAPFSIRVRQGNGQIVLYRPRVTNPVSALVDSLASGTGANQIGASLPGFPATTVGAAAFYNVPSGMLGVKSDAGTDDATALQAGIDYVAAAGGGRILLPPGKTTKCTVAPVIKDRVTLDLNGGRLLLTLTGTNAQGVRLRNNSWVENGTIEVQSQNDPVTGGEPGIGAGIHAPLCVGPIYSEGGTVSNPSPDEGVTGWGARNLILSSNKNVDRGDGVRLGSVAVQVTGGASLGILENIVVPDNAFMAGGIHFDWGYLGSIASDNIPASRANFDAGTAYTTHPNTIVVRNIKIGNLSRATVGVDTGSHGIRISGGYNILVENVRAKRVTYAFLRHTAGDVGFEFAPASVKPLACKNTILRNCVVEECSTANLIYSDSLADNIYRASLPPGQGGSSYVPLIDPFHQTNILFENVSGRGPNDATATFGVRFIQQRGGRAVGCLATQFLSNFVMDESTYDCAFLNCIGYNSRGDNFVVEHPTAPPRNCRVENATAYQAGQSGAGYANLLVGKSVDTTVYGGSFGADTGTEQGSYGIRVKTAADGVAGASIEGLPIIYSHRSGGSALLVASDESWGALKLFTGARYGSAVTTRWTGLSIVPVRLDSTGTEDIQIFRSVRAKLSADTTPPSGFPGKRGSRIEYLDPAAGGPTYTVCVSSGTPGIWEARA